MALVAFPWVASLITREPFLIGLVGTSLQLAWIGGPLIVGPLIDRSSRLHLIRASLLGQFWVAGLLGVAILLGIDLQLWDLDGGGAFVAMAVLIICVLALGIAEVIRDLGSQAVLPEITPSADLDRANSRLLTAELVTGRFVGQPIGGLLLTLGAGIPIILDSVTFLASAILLRPLLRPARQSGPTEGRASPMAATEMLDGMRWLIRVRIVRSMTFALAWSNLMSGIALSTLVLYCQEVLGLGALEYSILLTVGAGGGLLGGLLGPRVLHRFGPGVVTIACIAAINAAYALMWLSGSVLGVIIALAILSAAAMPWSVASRSLRQRVTPQQMMGRVSGAHRTINFGAIPIGMVLGGAIASIGAASLPLDEALRVPILTAAIGMALLLPIAGREFGRGQAWHTDADVPGST